MSSGIEVPIAQSVLQCSDTCIEIYPCSIFLFCFTVERFTIQIRRGELSELATTHSSIVRVFRYIRVLGLLHPGRHFPSIIHARQQKYTRLFPFCLCHARGVLVCPHVTYTVLCLLASDGHCWKSPVVMSTYMVPCLDCLKVRSKDD